MDWIPTLFIATFILTLGILELIEYVQDKAAGRRLKRDYEDWRKANPSGFNSDGTIGYDRLRTPKPDDPWSLKPRD